MYGLGSPSTSPPCWEMTSTSFWGQTLSSELGGLLMEAVMVLGDLKDFFPNRSPGGPPTSLLAQRVYIQHQIFSREALRVVSGARHPKNRKEKPG